MQVEFERGAPIASEEEAIRLIRPRKYNDEAEASVEGCIVEDLIVGPYISLGKMSGWPERVDWQKKYRLENEVFASLKEKGFIKKVTPIST